MTNPYKIEGPALISFSGGRSSAMMLCEIVRAHGGTLPDNIIVAFANTGKEHEETLTFTRRVGAHLRIDVEWLEWWPADDGTKLGGYMESWRRVDFDTASRKGEPFAELITRAGHPPNVVNRMCTQHLKLKPLHALMRSRGFDDYMSAAGIRADEPRRVTRMRARTDREYVLPLADANVTAAHVVEYWKRMPFDLGLPVVNNETVGGNCDLCFLKNFNKISQLIKQEPERALWWAEQEAKTGEPFRRDRPGYAVITKFVTQPDLFEEDQISCDCTD